MITNEKEIFPKMQIFSDKPNIYPDNNYLLSTYNIVLRRNGEMFLLENSRHVCGYTVYIYFNKYLNTCFVSIL